jgi:hypothetical protein
MQEQQLLAHGMALAAAMAKIQRRGFTRARAGMLDVCMEAAAAVCTLIASKLQEAQQCKQW